MILPLQLRHRTDADAAPDAWFFPGDSGKRWLDELARCGLAVADTRLFIVPRSLADRSTAGLLVLPAKGTAPEQRPQGMPYRTVAGRLFVPMDAVLHPPVTDAELRAVCSWPVAFFHPAFGLSGFDEESTFRVWNLLEPPKERSDKWNAAQPGRTPMPGLAAVVLAEPPSIDDVFGGAKEEIGGEPLADLPPAPGEPKGDAWSTARRKLKRLFFKGVSSAMGRVPHTGSRRTWLNDVEDWANRKLHALGEDLQRMRNKEIHRLLHLLETDPEAGLRHAIPMNNFPHRGVASPGGRLGWNWLNFDLSRLGGGPADFWSVPDDVHEVLRRRYREMADREMQLGHHRRAAYIYAELLGDLVSAANALKQGRWFREAALLYEEHLNNPLEAARCLADGGLLAEAVERYEKLGHWLEAADLHERMGNAAAAEAAVRRVVEELVARDDILGAAKLLEERLKAVDEALALLQSSWPSGRQAAFCLSAAFRLLARLGRHDAALERLAQLSRDPVTQFQALSLVTVLGDIASQYPHELVRHRSADFSRVLVARQLREPGLSMDEARRLTGSLARLAPQDRLLVRDINRFISERQARELRKPRVVPPKFSGKPAVLRRFDLPRQIQWLQLRRSGNYFFAAGVTPKRLTLVRGVWEGEVQSVSWDCPAEVVKGGLLLEPQSATEDAPWIRMTIASGWLLAPKKFPGADLFFTEECCAASVPWRTPCQWPLAFGDESVWAVNVAAGQGILSCHDAAGRLQRTIEITADLLEGADRSETTRLCLAAVGNAAGVALGNRLVVTRGDGGLSRIELPGQVIGLVATLPHTRQGIVALLETGVVMFWLGTDALIELDRDVASPMGAFVPGGPLVLISDARMILLDVDSKGVQGVTRVEHTGQRPVGVVGASEPGQFGVLGAGGQMTVYRTEQ